MSVFISRRQSIRWLPDEASEPTNTLVLAGVKTGCFLDVRFMKNSTELDWGIAGYRYPSQSDPNVVKFSHSIDSRTLNPVDDWGKNTVQPDGTILETGSMVNPLTGKMTEYEEVWKDEECETGLFVKNQDGTAWQARVGNYQVALGRRKDGVFWAWQAEREQNGAEWVLKYSTEDGGGLPTYLPEAETIPGWSEGAKVEWKGDVWIVLEQCG